MYEVFLDTETTGLSVNDKHRIVEIACIETIDLNPTKKIFHEIINPQRDVPEEAFKVHGFSSEFLKNKKTFISYLVCGDPSKNDTLIAMKIMADSGVDVIELGIPFTDPIADGPVIQKSIDRALKNNVSLKDVISVVEKFRKTNPPTNYSYHRYC